MVHVIPVSPSAAGIALWCDSEGRILKTFGEAPGEAFGETFGEAPGEPLGETAGDKPGLAGAFPAGRGFSSCLDPGSLEKSFSFLREIRERQATFNWEMQIGAENGPGRTLCFNGCMVEDRLLILGTGPSRELLDPLDDLMRMQNEQVNRVRFGLKEMSLKEDAAGRSEHDFYNELTRLNNDLANAQRELAKQNFELERLNRLKTQFLGMAAHDLRTPIGHILSYSDFLREEAAAVLTGEQLEFLSIIQSSSEFMLHLIDDFLDVSAIESGHLQLDRRPSDPRKLLEHNTGLNAVLAQKKNIRVVLQIEGALPGLSLDEGKIVQVLNNLISNAIKFSQPGTEVAVRAVAAEGGVRIAVHDQGPGIPESERGKLFQPFGKTSVRSTAGESSTGLGLAIVRKIVEGHGGRIWVESQVGVGSIFIFTLPE